MNEWCDFYRDVLGFFRYITFDDKDISTEYSALMSIVMCDGGHNIKFPINEPAESKKGKSQIQEYIDFYSSAGAQHVALLCKDILYTVDKLQKNGVEFLTRARHLLRRTAEPRRLLRRRHRRPQTARHPGRQRRRRLSAADFHQAGRRPPDGFLRDSPAQRLQRFRQRQLQGAVCLDRGRATPTREFVIFINMEKPINKYCPRSGEMVADDSLAAYRGFVVGFCNPGCRDDFQANVANAPERYDLF